jgi:hypothetical protein
VRERNSANTRARDKNVQVGKDATTSIGWPLETSSAPADTSRPLSGTHRVSTTVRTAEISCLAAAMRTT